MKSKNYFVIIGLICSLLSYAISLYCSLSNQQAIAVAITVLTVIWWISEALPIPATSLVPIAAFPLLGIVSHKDAAASLGSHVILLLMGAFMLSKAMEKSAVVHRLAIYMLRLVGANSGKRLVFGFMITTSLFSMWIANTATTLMMIPIAMAVMANFNQENQDNLRLKQALILGIAYSASVGGVATLVGTPPNVIFAGVYQELTGVEFSFAEWITIGLPVVIIAIPLMALWLTRDIVKTEIIQLPSLSSWRPEEWRTLIVIGLTAMAWVTRKDPFDGWSGLLNMPMAGDSTVVLVAVIFLFTLPDGKGGRLLDWKTAKTIPWGTLLLFAGGIALAKGLSASGLVTLLADSLTVLTTWPVYIMIASLCVLVTFLTEVTSNTATTTLLMPLLAAVATATEIDPRLLMIPAAMSASCAFMLPVATAPNAIAFGTGDVTIKDMLRQGVVLSVLLAVIISIVCYFRLS